MKKIILASTLIAAGGIAYAGGGALVPGSNSVSSGTCNLLSADVKATLSSGNVGYYDCNTSTASIGVAVASTTGKNKVYSLGSAGGAITETTTASAPTSSSCQTAATTASAVS